MIQESLLKLRFSFLSWLRVNSHPSFNLSHSQFGEDMVVRELSHSISDGFYVDIGAHHPIYISNTYHFYRRGWRGINIDALPGSMRMFNILRPQDINLEICIVPPGYPKQIKFFIFEASAFNTCDAIMAEQALSRGEKLVRTVMLPAFTLTEILDTYVPKGKEIDLMSIDVEGLDEEILMSNDWTRYQPKILVFEKHSIKLNEVEELETVKFLSNFDYELVAKMGPSLILAKRI